MSLKRVSILISPKGENMRLFCLRRVLLVFLLVVFVTGCATVGAQKPSHRNILWEIVTTCIDLHAVDYCQHCRRPRVDSPCGLDRACGNTTEVWEEAADYVALRDIKMCGCESDFVHGLAIPRTRVTGVEDPKRPDGIWNFAWDVAKKRIGDEAVIALVVNPPGLRGQDQLHVHIVRLLPDARNRFAENRSTRVQSLNGVWNAAAAHAAIAGLKDYGVLVAKRPEDDFLVLIDKESPEDTYTRSECR